MENSYELKSSGANNEIVDCERSLINLSAAQLLIAISEGEASVNWLTETFTELVADIENVLDQYRVNIKSRSQEELESSITNISIDICQRVHDGVMALQFYDRLTQRLDHITACLEKMGNMVTDEAKRNNTQEWKTLQELIKASYTMEGERKVFDDILQGMTVETVFADFKREQQGKPQEGDVELF